MYTVTDVLQGGTVPIRDGAIAVSQPPHSVRVLKIVDSSIPEATPAFAVHGAGSSKAGEAVEFSVSASDDASPVLQYKWTFGDGVSGEGVKVSHTYTLAGSYTVAITAVGLNGRTVQQTLPVSVTGFVPTLYDPSAKERYQAPK